MNVDAVQAIATQVVQNEILFNWKYHAITLLLMFIAAAAGSFITAYFKGRGQHLATKADFDSLLSQLKSTTEVAEKIKAEVSREDWTLREIKTLRRLKLEELMIAVLDTQNWLEKERSHVLFGGEKNIEREPATRVKLIAALYFPELSEEIGTFYLAFLAYNRWLLEHGNNLTEQQQDIEGNRRVLQQAMESFGGVYRPVLAASAGLEAKARQVMSEIFGIAL